MTEIYGNFGIELNDKSFEKQVADIIQSLGEIGVKHTRRDTIVFNYNTPTFTTPYITEVSDALCEKIEPFVDVFADFYQKHKEKCYMNLCFVVSELGEEGISIIINHRLLRLAFELGVDIHFDGL